MFALAWIVIPLLRFYTMEVVDATAIHMASQSHVQQLSRAISETRHGIAMHYTVERYCSNLQRGKKGIINFEPMDVLQPHPHALEDAGTTFV
jgi:hypothetical protein